MHHNLSLDNLGFEIDISARTLIGWHDNSWFLDRSNEKFAFSMVIWSEFRLGQ